MVAESGLSVVGSVLRLGFGAMMMHTMGRIAIVAMMLMQRHVRMLLMGLMRARRRRRRQMLGDARTPSRSADDQRCGYRPNQATMQHPAHAGSIGAPGPLPQCGRYRNRCWRVLRATPPDLAGCRGPLFGPSFFVSIGRSC